MTNKKVNFTQVVSGFRNIEFIFIILLGFIISIFFWGIHSSHKTMEKSFNNLTNSHTFTISERINSYLDVLNGGKALFDSSEYVSPDEWEQYMKTVKLTKTLPNGIGFNERLILELPDMSFRSSLYNFTPHKNIHYYLKYFYPKADSIGVDSVYAGRNNVGISRSNNNGIASILITKVFDVNGVEKDVLMLFLPVYLDADKVITEQNRRDNIHGYIFTYFDYEDIFFHSSNIFDTNNFRIKVYDKKRGKFIFDNTISTDDYRFANKSNLNVFGNNWEIHYFSEKDFSKEQFGINSLWILIFVFGLGVLFFTLVWIYILNNKANKIALEMTTSYEKAQQKLKSQNKKISDSYSKLKVLDESKDNFIDMISHELRTPLMVLNGYVNLFLEGKLGLLTEKQLEYFSRMKSNLTRQLSMITDILDVSRIQSGNIEVKKDEFDVFRSLRHKVEDFSHGASEKNIDINLDGSSLFVFGDMSKVEQIINNIISNSIKFTDKGSINVSLSSNKKKNSYKITIEDTGIGIRKEDFSKVFDRFGQVGIGMKREEAGTGLGMTITKMLVEAMGGQINFTSEYGVGTKFIVELPINP